VEQALPLESLRFPAALPGVVLSSVRIQRNFNVGLMLIKDSDKNSPIKDLRSILKKGKHNVFVI
jgi:hypothetical protein